MTATSRFVIALSFVAVGCADDSGALLTDEPANQPPDSIPDASTPESPSTPDAAVDAAPSPPSVLRLMKEDFEGGELDMAAWRSGHETATYAIDSTRFHRGAASLRIDTSNMNANPWNSGYIATKQSFPLAGHSLFVRAPLTNFSATVDSKWAVPTKVDARVGFWTSHRESISNGGYSVWFDDIVIDDKKIGCAD